MVPSWFHPARISENEVHIVNFHRMQDTDSCFQSSVYESPKVYLVFMPVNLNFLRDFKKLCDPNCSFQTDDKILNTDGWFPFLLKMYKN